MDSLASFTPIYTVDRSSANTNGILFLLSRLPIRSSIVMINNVGDNTPPYMTPLPIRTL